MKIFFSNELNTQEVPNELSFTIVLIDNKGCPFKCPDCSWANLELDKIYSSIGMSNVISSINKNNQYKKLINSSSCILIMWCSRNYEVLEDLIIDLKDNYPNKKIAIYSGLDLFNLPISEFDNIVYNKINIETAINNNCNYLKVGFYVESLGGLDKSTTNQKFYKKNLLNKWEDKTFLFYK